MNWHRPRSDRWRGVTAQIDGRLAVAEVDLDLYRKKALLAEIISKVNDLFEGELTDDDKLVYVNNVLKGKLLEAEILMRQAANNSKQQFANSPDLSIALMNAIIEAFEAHGTMSKQALDSEKVRNGLQDILLGPAQLYEALREKGAGTTSPSRVGD